MTPVPMSTQRNPPPTPARREPKVTQRRPWKEYHFPSHDDMGAISSAWMSSHEAFGPGKELRVIKGAGAVETNLSDRNFRSLCRHAGVARVPDYVSDTRPSWDSSDDEDDDMAPLLAESRVRRMASPTHTS